jgi:hypothetical protein
LRIRNGDLKIAIWGFGGYCQPFLLFKSSFFHSSFHPFFIFYPYTMRC